MIRRLIGLALPAVAVAACAGNPGGTAGAGAAHAGDPEGVIPAAGPPACQLTGFAVLPALTFEPGPVSGRFATAANGVEPPVDGQPVQGFSALLRDGDAYLALSDNGYGSRENSPDCRTRNSLLWTS